MTLSLASYLKVCSSCVSKLLTKVWVMARVIVFKPSEKMGAVIESHAGSGDFNNQSEVIRTAILLLEEQTAASKLQQFR